MTYEQINDISVGIATAGVYLGGLSLVGYYFYSNFGIWALLAYLILLALVVGFFVFMLFGISQGIENKYGDFDRGQLQIGDNTQWLDDFRF